MRSPQDALVYLSWPQDPAHSVCVNWLGPTEIPEWEVEFQVVGQADWLPGAALPPQRVDAERVTHSVLVGRLPPDSAVRYRFRRGSEVFPGDTTRTAPVAGQPFKAVFFADTGLIGRPDGNATGTAQVYADIAAEAPLFLIGAGDYAYANRDGRYERIPDAIDEWFRQAGPLLRRFPLYAQYGNHETLLKERFTDWGPRFRHPSGFEDDRSYAFDIGGVHFAMAFFPDKKLLAQEHVDWLDRDLAAARAAGAKRLVVIQHEPIYGHGRSHPAFPGVRQAVVPVLDRHRVDLHLSAHDQNYERTAPLVHEQDAEGTWLPRMQAGDANWPGVVYAKISPAGKMSEIGNCFSQFTVPKQDFMVIRDDTAHHYGVVEVDAQARISVKVYALKGDGSPRTLLDHFVV